MGRRPKVKQRECRTCGNIGKGCFLCLNFSEYEPIIDIRKELRGKPSEREMGDI
jgi:hypothetical protein